MQTPAKSMESFAALTREKHFCLLFCGLVLAYKQRRPASECLEMIGLPSRFIDLLKPLELPAGA